MLRTSIACLLDFFAGGGGLFKSRGITYGQKPDNALVLSPGEIPTTQIYLKKHLAVRFGEEVRYVDALRTLPQQHTLTENTLIVIVRHAPLNWLHWLKHKQRQLAGIVFFMDDDIPSVLRAPEIPFRYAMKTAWRYARSRCLLSRICTEVWLSTPELIQRYADSFPQLHEPEYVATQLPDKTTAVYFYHGTWAHQREIEWLVPIVRQVQQAVPHAWFEIFGTDRVRHLFRGIPRVRVVHPMPWIDYLAYADTVTYQIGLAPCFDTPFNRARSHSKLFDITRLGAAGIYSNVTPYAEKIIHGKIGFLCANDKEKWVVTISQLLGDQKLRSSVYCRAKEWCNTGRLME